MYLSITNFKNDWAYEYEATFKQLSALTNASLTVPMPANVRSIATLAWHIVHSISEMINHTELQINAVPQEAIIGLTVTDLVTEYKKTNQEFVAIIGAWEYNQLTVKTPMYGEEWTKGKVLQIIMQHQIHHRAQLGILMRIAGLQVPGVYGPSKEEWAAKGMEAMK
ncbi:MAG: DinB family protein [Bacteroidia bacterium]|nr:DinB family protein [Bacteroidia bacterium]